MMKNMKKLLALALVLIMAVCTFAACGEDEKKDVSAPADEPVIAEKNLEAEAEINDYIDSQAEYFEPIAASYKEQGVDMSIYADGDALVYDLKLAVDVPADQLDDISAQLESGFAGFDVTAEAIFNECDAVQSVRAEYYDIDGTELFVGTCER